MLNGFSLNGAALNASAGTLLVLASAAFTADASVTPPTAIHTQAIRAVVTTSSAASISATRVRLALLDVSFQTQIVVNKPLMDRAGVGMWAVDTTFQPIIQRVIPSSAGFDAEATIEAIPNSKLGTGDWTAGLSTDLVQTKLTAATGAFSADGVWAASSIATDVFVDRGSIGSWAPDATFRAEWTYQPNGSLDWEHEGYTFWIPGGDWDTTPELVAHGTFLFFEAAFGEWAATSTHTEAARGTWTLDGTWDSQDNKVQFVTVAMTADATIATAETHTHNIATLTFTPTSLFEGGLKGAFVGAAAWTPGATVLAGASHNEALQAQLVATATVSAPADRVKPAEAEIDGGLILVAPAKRTAGARANWLTAVVTLNPAAVQGRVPAPLSRQYALSDLTRTFELSGTSRRYEVSS